TGIDGKLHEVRRMLDCSTAREAARELAQLLQETREIRSKPPAAPLFADYAPALIERKGAIGELRSAESRHHRLSVIRLHLSPAFATYRMDEITRQKLVAWRDSMAREVTSGEITPNTGNDRIKIMLMIMHAWVDESDQPVDPTRRIRTFDTTMRRTYTRE